MKTAKRYGRKIMYVYTYIWRLMENGQERMMEKHYLKRVLLKLKLKGNVNY